MHSLLSYQALRATLCAHRPLPLPLPSVAASLCVVCRPRAPASLRHLLRPHLKAVEVPHGQHQHEQPHQVAPHQAGRPQADEDDLHVSHIVAELR